MKISHVGEGKVVLIAGGGTVYADVAARFCHSNKELEDIIATPYNKKIVENILNAGHFAALEFDNFIFGIEGYSRVTEVQLVRKRLASYMISSGRDERNGKREYSLVLPDEKKLKDLKLVTNESFPGEEMTLEEYLALGEKFYNKALEMGIKEEDARYIKPQATAFKAIISMNSHALLDWFKIRCCCYDQDTEVLTTEGWKFFKDLTGKEKVYSMDPKTHKAHYCKIKKVIVDDYNGPMISVKSQSIDLLVTPNHKMYMSYGYPSYNHETKGTKFRLDYGYDFDTHKTIRMKKNCRPVKGKKDRFFIIPGLTVQDGNQYTTWNRTISPKVVDVNQFMAFLGMYLADGSVSKSGDHYYITIGKGDYRLIEKYSEILSSISDNSVQVRLDKQHNNPFWFITVHDRRLYEYLAPLGKAYDKHIPEEVFEYDYDALLSLMEGLLDGDGKYDQKNDSYSYSTISPRLRDDFQRLALHLGFSSTYGIDNRVGELGGTINGRPIIHKHIGYSLSLNRKKNEPIIKTSNRNAFSIDIYNGKIYCVELSKYHTLYVRRNGKCVWCGNSNAQTEIRDLAWKMLKLCKEAKPDIFAKAGPGCVQTGFCTENSRQNPWCKEHKKVITMEEAARRIYKLND